MIVGEQALWRAVHEIGARVALSEDQLSDLRHWAGGRARMQPGTVFGEGGLGLRASFRTAIRHEADRLMKAVPALKEITGEEE